MHDGTSQRTGIAPWVQSGGVINGGAVALGAVEVGGTCLHYATEVVGQGVAGDAAIALQGDAWHEPSVRLYCGTRPRQNLCRHDTLQLRVRAAAGRVGHTFPSVQLRSWSHSGRVVSLAQWVVDDPAGAGDDPPPAFDPTVGFDTVYRLVRVPLRELVGEAATPGTPYSSFHPGALQWELWDVGTLQFGNTSTGCARSSVESAVFSPFCKPM